MDDAVSRPLTERRRRLAELEATAADAERRGCVADAVEAWTEALRSCRLVPAAIKVHTQAALFALAESRLYEPARESDAHEAPTLSGLVAQFRAGHLSASYDWESLCAQFAELRCDEADGPAVECLWLELLNRSPRACELALALRPRDITVECCSARHSIEAGRLIQARERLLCALSHAPACADALGLLRQVDEDLLDGPDYVRSRMEMADVLLGQGQCDAALRELSAAKRRGGESVDGLVKETWCLSELQRMEPARVAAERGVAVAPDSAEAHLALGTVLRKLDELKPAAEALDRCAELAEPTGPLRAQAREIASCVYGEIGEAAYLAGDLPAASRAYKLALERDAHHGRALARMGRMAELAGDYPTAARLWASAAAGGDRSVAWRARVCALLAEDKDECRLQATEQCAANGDVPWAEAILQHVQSPQLREQHELFESIPAALTELSEVCGRAWELLGSGDRHRARDLFVMAQPLCPGHQRVLRGMAHLLAEEGDSSEGAERSGLLAEAEAMLRQCISVDPTSEDADLARDKLAAMGRGLQSVE